MARVSITLDIKTSSQRAHEIIRLCHEGFAVRNELQISKIMRGMKGIVSDIKYGDIIFGEMTYTATVQINDKKRGKL